MESACLGYFTRSEVESSVREWADNYGERLQMGDEAFSGEYVSARYSTGMVEMATARYFRLPVSLLPRDDGFSGLDFLRRCPAGLIG